MSARWFVPFSMLAVGLLGFLLYSRALDFAFFNDDPTGHFAWMETRGYLDYFRSSAEYGYYRPVVFVVLQALVDAVAYDARVFHAFLLGVHAANVALLWLLVWRMSDSAGYAWSAALIFAFSPFNYEAVAYVASLTHPLLLFWLLCTLLLYQQARRSERRSRRRLLYAAAMATTLLGLLTHENGLFIPLAIVGLEWLERPPTRWKEGLRRPFWAYLLTAPLFLLIWWSIPKNGEQVSSNLDAWLNNLMPFLQTLVYPLLPLASLTAEQTTALAILAAFALFATALAAWWARELYLWLFALGWFAFSMLPATLFLPPDYLYGSPRLHYLPTVGVAMLWALPVLGLARHMPQPGSERVAVAAAGVIYVLAIAWPPTEFISCELEFYAEASALARRMGDIGRQVEGGKELLFVNLPVFFSSFGQRPQGCENPYPWTPTGAVFMPDYANARDFVRFNGGPNRRAQGVSVPGYAPGWRVAGEDLSGAELRSTLTEATVFVYDLNAGNFYDLSTAWQPGGARAVQSLASFGESLQLTAVEVQNERAENKVIVTLAWNVLSAPEAGLAPTVFVHLYDESGNLVAQHDGPPASNFAPSKWWQAGDRLVDSHQISLPATVPPGIYRLGIGLYHSNTGTRFSASAGLEPLPDDVFYATDVQLP